MYLDKTKLISILSLLRVIHQFLHFASLWCKFPSVAFTLEVWRSTYDVKKETVSFLQPTVKSLGFKQVCNPLNMCT